MEANDHAMTNSDDPMARCLRQQLDALLAHRTTKAASETDHDVEPLHTWHRLGEPPRPRWIRLLQAAAEDGVEQSLLASIREKGWRAFAAGGLPAMRRLAEQACDDDGRLETILDHHWDGIGIDERGHWVC